MTDQDIIEAAVKISDETERSQYIELASQGDSTRRRRIEAQVVQAFVGVYEKTGEAPLPSSATMTSAATPPTRPATPSPFAAGSGSDAILVQGGRIGPYKLLQKLGEGGMGSVWMAEQEKPVRRVVAVKAIKPGMDSDRVLARFEAERQALALMDHPNIAKVLDAGTTENGCPYFVMELVKGVPVTKYCDDQKLDIKARLELFIPICQAIQHAHQKGIIHRDIKPSNVMVALYDGRPIPKVIDFGIAKATGPKLTDKTIFTEFGTVIGTLEYMAPEQAELNALDIDTRSDIYSLGVMLYELLTGSTPLGRDTLQRAAFAEVIRRIKEEEPPRPSTRLSDSKDSLPGISAQRQTEPAKLPQSIRGDLDWIVMKALAKERDRRYATCNNFAVDLMHFLQNEPVTARPPSAVYLLQKFVRRHRAVVASTAVSLVLLIGATIFSTGMYVKAEQERKKAVTSEQAALASEKQAANTLNFTQDVLLRAAGSKETGGLGKTATLKEALDAAVPQMGVYFKEHPEIEASVYRILGTSYFFVGDHNNATKLLKQSWDLQKNSSDTSDNLARTIDNYTMALTANENNIDVAATTLENALKDRVQQRGGSDQLVVIMKNNLAWIYEQKGRLDDAVKLYEEVIKDWKVRYGESHIKTQTAESNLGLVYRKMKQNDKALALFERILREREKDPGLDHIQTVESAEILLVYYDELGLKPDEVFRLLKIAVAYRLKQSHPEETRRVKGIERLVKKYIEKKEFANAAELLKTQYEALVARGDRIPPEQRTLLFTTAQQCAGVFKAWGNSEEEKKWLDTAKAHQPKA